MSAWSWNSRKAMTFRTQSQKLDHVLEVHGFVDPHLCCDRKFWTKTDLIKHVQNHVVKKVIEVVVLE
jgi:hypothetical protein